jgi:hypothetical protein
MRPSALQVLGIHPVIPDFRVSHTNDLTAITRISENLLIPGHRSVEAHLAVDFANGPKRNAGENGAVF